MNKKKDICFFYEEYSFSGGVKTYIDQINNYLITQNYDTTIISLIKGDGCFSLVNRKNINIRLTPLYLFKLLLFFNKNDFKIIHCQSLYSLILMNFVKRILGKNFSLISTAHIPYGKSMFIDILNFLKIKIKTEYLIGCCKYALDETQNKKLLYTKNSTYILNWSFEYHYVNPIENDNKIAFVGHLAYQKNIDLLKDTILSLPQYKFKIIGDGEEKHKLDKITNASLLGQLKHNMVIEEIRKSKLLILTSRFEALPYVILEALSLGIPVVSSDVGGIYELGEYTNQLFLCKNKDDFITHISEIFDNRKENYYNNIQKISFKNQILKYMKIYKLYL